MKIGFIVSCACAVLYCGGAFADMPLAEKLEAMKNAYPLYIKSVSENMLVLSNDEKLVIDDGRAKNHQEKLKSPDIEDMLSQVYPVGKCYGVMMSPNFDPGRIREERLFRYMYGGTAQQVRENLVTVDWFGRKIQFTKINNAHEALQKVRDELVQFPELRQYLTPAAGTFNWRNIAGTDRLSVHSFAAAIDLNTTYAHYWRWSGGKPGNVKPYKNRFPEKVVEIFEKHGFIWGGKWYHYDSMHFEYRPELIAIGNKFDGSCQDIFD